MSYLLLLIPSDVISSFIWIKVKHTFSRPLIFSFTFECIYFGFHVKGYRHEAWDVFTVHCARTCTYMPHTITIMNRHPPCTQSIHNIHNTVRGKPNECWKKTKNQMLRSKKCRGKKNSINLIKKVTENEFMTFFIKTINSI